MGVVLGMEAEWVELGWVTDDGECVLVLCVRSLRMMVVVFVVGCY